MAPRPQSGWRNTNCICREQPSLSREQIQPVLWFLCHGITELLPPEETAQGQSGQVKERVEQVYLNMFVKHGERTLSQCAQRNRVVI